MGNPKPLLSITGALEAATGLLLLAVPSVLVELLLGEALGSPVGSRSAVTGAAVLALGVACWLARGDAASRAAKGLVAAMLLYNLAVVALLVIAWTSQGLFGIGLWPIVLVHAAMAIWCVASLQARAPS